MKLDSINNASSVYLKINCAGNDISDTFEKGSKFECILLGKKFEITIDDITSDNVILKSNAYGLFPKRKDGTISLIQKVNTFKLQKNKKLYLQLQVTDMSWGIEIIWE